MLTAIIVVLGKIVVPLHQTRHPDNRWMFLLIFPEQLPKVSHMQQHALINNAVHVSAMMPKRHVSHVTAEPFTVTAFACNMAVRHVDLSITVVY